MRVESRDKSERRGNKYHADDHGREDKERFRHGSGYSHSHRRESKVYNTGGYYPPDNEDQYERPRRPNSRGEARGPEFPNARFTPEEPLPKLQKLSSEGHRVETNTETGTSGLAAFLNSKFKR